jgi:tRNA (mo5U34)-methyltransferase
MDLSRQHIEERVQSLGQWFHNIDLHGVKTAPDHFLGDYPNIKWQRFAHAVPDNLEGRSVLDVGCNAGFYSIEMKKRGAGRVVAIDSDDTYLEQGRFAARVCGYGDIEFRNMSVYDVGKLGERFDVVIFMGVLYHLRHPLLALDILRESVVDDLMIFQSMQRGSRKVAPVAADYEFWDSEVFEREGYPLMYFVEQKYAHDGTNWWIPNRAAVEAMLRSSGFTIVDHPEDEVYLCRKAEPWPSKL